MSLSIIKLRALKTCLWSTGQSICMDDRMLTLRDTDPSVRSYWDHVGGDSLDCALEAAAHFARFVVSVPTSGCHLGQYR